MGSKYPFEEYTTVWLIPDGVADVAAPTLAEIADGTDITCYLTRDGLNTGGSTNMVDGGGLCNRFDSQTVGTVSSSPTLKGFRYTAEDDGDVFWDLVNWGDPFALVVRRGVRYGTEAQAGDVVEVYNGQTGEPIPADSAANTNQTFEVAFAIDSQEKKATVAAS